MRRCIVVGGTTEDSLPRYASEPPISTNVSEVEQGPIPSPPPSPPPLPPPPTSNAPRKLPSRQPIPSFPLDAGTFQQHNQARTSAPANHGVHQRDQSGQESNRAEQRPYLRTYANMQSNAVASTSKNTLSVPQDPKVSGLPRDAHSTGLMSPPSSQDSVASIRSIVTQAYPDVATALQQNPRRRQKSGKQYIEREHILAKQVSIRLGS